ncbi:MAG: YdcF family protein [Magnetococcales bacterium]|nr:YdcF family protein [Magnetococcales bacterium]
MTVQTTRIIEWMLLPPGITILLILFAILAWNRHKRDRGRGRPVILWLALFSLYFMSINFTANQLITLLEQPDKYPPLTLEQINSSKAEAIIILGHGRYAKAPDYDNEDTLNTGGLARARYGAKLYRASKLPILTSGGTPRQEPVSEAAIMKKVLEGEFNVPVRWLEESSNNTYENALFSSKILEKAGVKKALIVTHSRDIIRALRSFEKVGIIEAVPAPTLFGKRPNSTSLINWIPNPYALGRTAVALHELAGMVWYSIRY